MDDYKCIEYKSRREAELITARFKNPSGVYSQQAEILFTLKIPTRVSKHLKSINMEFNEAIYDKITKIPDEHVKEEREDGIQVISFSININLEQKLHSDWLALTRASLIFSM